MADNYLDLKTGSPVVVPDFRDWEDWTPTGSWTTNATYVGKKCRIGSKGCYQVLITLSGAPTAASLTINQPSGEVIATSKLLLLNGSAILGWGTARDVGTSAYPLTIGYQSSTSVSTRVTSVSGSLIINSSAASQVTPFTFGATDEIYLYWEVPIVGWDIYTVVGLPLNGVGGTNPDTVTSLPSTLVTNTAYKVAQSVTTNAALPVTASASTISVTDVTGNCSATNEIGITAGAGQSIRYRGQLISGADRFVMRRANVDVTFSKEAGATIWEVDYQTIAVPQAGQIPGGSTSTIAYPNIGFTQEALVATNTAVATSTNYFIATSLLLLPGKYSLTGIVWASAGAGTMTALTAGLTSNSALSSAGLTSGIDSFDGPPATSAYNSMVAIPDLIVTVPPGAGVTYYLKSAFYYTSGSPVYRARLTAKIIG